MTGAGQATVGTADDRAYTFVLPPGWFRIDLRKPMAAQVGELADMMLSQKPAGGNDQKLRLAMVNQLMRAAHAARSSKVLDLVLPVALIEGTALPASWAFMPLSVPGDGDPIEALAAIASQNPTAELIEVRDLVALRIRSRTPKATEQLDTVLDSMASDLGEGSVPVDGEGVGQLWTERVQYFLGHPQQPGNWIIVAASITDTGGDDHDVLTPALVELFDEVVKTVRMPDA